MVTIQQETATKNKTIKQIVLINNLLQSRYFHKEEFEYYKMLELFNCKTSFDASVLIGLLIATVRLKKRIYNKRNLAKLKCDYCGSKENLNRCFNLEFEKQKVICEDCELKKDMQELEQQELAEANRERLDKELNPVDEKQEASADLYRKYEYEKPLSSN